MQAGSAASPVFVITHEFFPRRGGIATFTEEIAKATAGLGITTEVWAPDADDLSARDWPFRLHRIPVKGTHDVACQLGIARQLVAERRRLRYATVYLPEPGPMLAMMMLQHIPGFCPKRLVLTFHGSEILRFHRNAVTRLLARKLIARANRISTLSHYTGNLLLRHFPEAEGKVVFTPGALRSDFAIVEPPAAGPRKKVVVLTVGRLHPRKGQHLTLQALNSLAPRFRKKIEYWIVGSGNRPRYEQMLRDLAANAGFPVRFFGDLPDAELDEVYDRADIFAMNSVEHGTSIEGFGLVYLEASAHGIPVVGHDIGGVSEAVDDGVTGLLVPPGHPAQLAAAFEKLVSDPGLRRRLGRAGVIWARKNTWDQSARVLFDAPLPALA
jgi:phosphatidyl-myo-inositol dimannoside synthase